jgi:hypothetical protein
MNNNDDRDTMGRSDSEDQGYIWVKKIVKAIGIHLCVRCEKLMRWFGVNKTCINCEISLATHPVFETLPKKIPGAPWLFHRCATEVSCSKHS